MRRVIHSRNGDGDSHCCRVYGSVIDLEGKGVSAVEVCARGIAIGACCGVNRYRAIARITHLGKGKSVAVNICARQRSSLKGIFIC